MAFDAKELLPSLGLTGIGLAAWIIVGIAFLLKSTVFTSSLKHIPSVSDELGGTRAKLTAFAVNAKQLFRKGYQTNTPFRITTLQGENVVIPYHLLDDVKSRTDDEIANIPALDRLTQKKLSGLESTSLMMNHLVRSDLTSSLNRINPRLYKAAAEAVASEFPPCEEWTAVKFNDPLLRVIAIVSGYIFLGPELCRNEEYMHLSIRYTIDAFTGVAKLNLWPTYIRWIGTFFVPELKKIKEYRRRVCKFLGPIIQARRKAMAKPGFEAPDDLLQWSLGKAARFEDEIKSDDDVAIMQLRLSLAAIHTTSTTGLHLIYDICSYPGLIATLRAEIEDVLAKHNGVLSTKALYDMKLLDSCMKESQRLNPLGTSSFTRWTMRGVTLKDGTYLPPNTYIEAPIEAIGHDPNIWSEPEKFDPWRFYNLRKAEEDGGRYQFVTLSKEVMSFGYGRHACPGRFFAANEIKLIMIEVLRKYDIELKGNEGRYKNIQYFGANSADTSKELMMRRVKS